MKSFLIIITVLAIAVVAVLTRQPSPQKAGDSSSPSPVTLTAPADAGIPLPRARERVTLKPFGISIGPGDSPVSPERFSGYHTGADFEVLLGEDETTLAVRALCTGRVVQSRRVSGYGGVVLQQCTIAEQRVTILYGHLAPSSLVAAGTALERAGPVGALGRGFSPDTDEERPHLHLGVIRGWRDEFRGYVASPEQLDLWMDPLPLIP